MLKEVKKLGSHFSVHNPMQLPHSFRFDLLCLQITSSAFPWLYQINFALQTPLALLLIAVETLLKALNCSQTHR